MKIYYVYPDYIDEIVNNDEKEYKELVKQGKASVYSLTTFIDDFNNGNISDLGMLFSTDNDESFF